MLPLAPRARETRAGVFVRRARAVAAMDLNSQEFYGGGLKEGEVSTGTTIMAVAYDGGVIMGADSRVSTGTYIANRVSDKVSHLHDKIFMCRSGSAADTQAVSDYVRHYLGSHAIEVGKPPLVKTAANLAKRICYTTVSYTHLTLPTKA